MEDIDIGKFIFEEVIWKEKRNNPASQDFKRSLDEIKEGKIKRKYHRNEMGEFLFDEPKDKNRRPFEREMWAAVYNNDIDGYITAILAGADNNYRDKFGYTTGERAKYLGYADIAKYFDDPVDLAGGSRCTLHDRQHNPYVIKLYENADKLKNDIVKELTELNLSPEQYKGLF